MISTLTMKLIGGAVVAALIASAFFYVQHLRTSLAVAEANGAVLEETNKSTKNAYDNLHTDFKALQKSIEVLAVETKKAREDVQRLETRFTETKTGEQRRLDNLAARHPKLIENAINNGTKEAFRCNELATGAKPEPEEKNSICPSLLQ